MEKEAPQAYGELMGLCVGDPIGYKREVRKNQSLSTETRFLSPHNKV
jgi:ADP-ribosylglycohydrolase